MYGIKLLLLPNLKLIYMFQVSCVTMDLLDATMSATLIAFEKDVKSIIGENLDKLHKILNMVCFTELSAIFAYSNISIMKHTLSFKQHMIHSQDHNLTTKLILSNFIFIHVQIQIIYVIGTSKKLTPHQYNNQEYYNSTLTFDCIVFVLCCKLCLYFYNYQWKHVHECSGHLTL